MSIYRATGACSVLSRVAEEGNPELSPADRARWLAQCDVEIDNFRFALDWLFRPWIWTGGCVSACSVSILDMRNT